MKHYETLGLSKEADENEIKKAYMKLARQYHPDKNQGSKEAEEKFKKINEAYEVLSDPEKRNMYNQLGDDMFNQNMSNQQNVNPFDIFNRMFGGGFNFDSDMSGSSSFGFGDNPFSFMFDLGGNSNRKRRVVIEDIVIQKKVTLKQLYCNETIQLEFNCNILCKKCDATGTKDKSKSVCSTCNGKGQVVNTIQTGFMIQQHISTCSNCNGTGVFIHIHNRCDNCKGEGYVKENRTFNLKLEKEMLYNNKIKIPNIGHSIKESNEKGNVIVILEVDQSLENNMEYKIYNKIHLYRKIKISLADALNGFSLKIKFLDNENITFKRDQITQPSSVYKLPNLGYLPNGNLYLKIIVFIPENMPQHLIQPIVKAYSKRQDNNLDNKIVDNRVFDVIEEINEEI